MVKRSKFQLLKLPALCVENVVRNLKIYDMIEMSLLSRRMHRIVKRARVPQISLRLVIYRKGTMVVINKGPVFFQWVFIEQSSPLWCDWIRYRRYMKYRNRQVLGVQMAFMMMMDNEKRHLRSLIVGDTSIMIRTVINYLQNLFRCPLMKLVYINPDENPDKDPEIRSHSMLEINECRNLTFYGEKEMNLDYLVKTIEEVKFTESLTLNIPIKSLPFEMSKVKSKKIAISGNQSWINRDVLFSIECDQILLCNCNNSLTSDDVNAFVDRWFDSEKKTFKVLVVKMETYEQPSDFEKYEPLEWCKETRGRYYRYQEQTAINLSKGMDIQRKDDSLATVFFKEGIFFFGVWHNRFPNLDGVEIWKFKEDI